LQKEIAGLKVELKRAAATAAVTGEQLAPNNGKKVTKISSLYILIAARGQCNKMLIYLCGGSSPQIMEDEFTQV